LHIIQNKFNQKTFLDKHNLPVGEFKKINTLDELYKISDIYGFPLLLKSCRGGYDGKGNYFIKSREDIPLAYEELGGGKLEIMAETYIDFKKEVSVIAARGMSGEIKIYPLGENIHENNILKTTIVPARVSEEIVKKAEDLAFKTMDVLKGVGIFCIEMFLDQNDELLINEIAPRTHNSGHYTIEASSTSQFNQHIRAILGLSLGSTSLIRPAVMINLLGEEGYEGNAKLVGMTKALKIPDLYIHFYGKTITKPERKMGHITVLGNDIKEILEKTKDINKIVKVIAVD
ncbi:MAG: 5-(carboxyamino)imidazole ribonucleotide synthase, partial [Clostridiales bacterium]|nr:5-(carboxyamino)imidazole ribonucleotide synthase [Clostridiales bacterium]